MPQDEYFLQAGRLNAYTATIHQLSF